MPNDLEARIAAIEDQTAIRDLAARFTDCVNERDLAGYSELWTPDAVWEIGTPNYVRAEGVPAIVDLLDRLLLSKVMFVQLTHSGVIQRIDQNTATARFTIRERGKGQADFYDNLAVYHDECVRTNVGWRFKRRFYDYRFLDFAPFTAAAVASKAENRVVAS